MSSSTTFNSLDSSVLRLESLESEFDLVMTQYKQAYLDYINSLQTMNSDNVGKNREFTSLQGRRFWGTGGIKDIRVHNADECIAACAEDSKCTGTTFNSSSGYCWIRSGNGDVTISDNKNEYALMPNISQNTNNLKMLNDKLIKLNIDIMNELNSSEATVFNENQNKNVKKVEMENTNQELLIERVNIMKLFDQYDDLNAQYDINSIYVRQSSESYILWTLLAITIIVIIIKMIVTPQSRGSDNIKFIFMMVFGSAFIISITKLSNPAGFAFFGVLLLIIIFISGSGSGSSSNNSRSGYGLGQPASLYNSYSQK